MRLDVRAVASLFECSRIGIIVPRHQHSAVDRNRLKRRLRELARTVLLPVLRDRPATTMAMDVAIRARREAYAAEFADLRGDMMGVAAALGADAS